MHPVIARAFSLLRFVTLRKFDVSTDEGRAQERQRLIVLGALASTFAKVVSVSTALISVPLTLHYLGAERYGMWMTMSAITAMLSFADFGIGNGVLTAVAKATGRDEFNLVRAYVSSAFAMLSSLALLILTLLVLAYGQVNWHSIFNVKSAIARGEAAPAIAVFITCFALAMPLSIVQRVQMGLQLGFVASLWQSAASLAGLAAVLVAIYNEMSLPWLVVAFAGTPLIIAAINTLHFFMRVRPEFAPKRREIGWEHTSFLLKTGGLFFVIQIVIAVAYTSDNLVIARLLGPEVVANFAVPDRMFAMASMIVGLAVTPLWPAFGEALSRGDKLWARRMLIRATIISAAVSGLAGIVLVLLGPILLHLWVGSAVSAPLLLLMGFATWRLVEASMGPSAMYLNGRRVLGLQLSVAIVTAIGTLALKLFLVPRYGIVAIPWSSVTVYFVFTVIPIFFYMRKHA